MKTKHKNVRACRVCGCTEKDCRGCIERTGRPCSWIEADLCSACAPVPVYHAAVRTFDGEVFFITELYERADGTTGYVTSDKKTSGLRFTHEQFARLTRDLPHLQLEAWYCCNMEVSPAMNAQKASVVGG